VRREALLARDFDLHDIFLAPCHHQEEKESAVVQ